jgi:trans-aconitate methyltransferase
VDPRRHWDAVYEAAALDRVSWYERHPAVSLALVVGVAPDLRTPILDVGGGTSALAGALVSSGYSDVSVVDVSLAALRAARRASPAPTIEWIEADVTAWRPLRAYGVWHDRAVLHFLVNEGDRAAYVRTLSEALAPEGAAVIGTFAEDGPTHCSGLPVRRYSPAGLRDALAPGFVVVAERRERHRTPDGAEQPFTWVVARRATR